MFHSSSFRHEQYIIRSNSSKATLHKKRSSLESENSGADSGYTSSSSSSPTNATATTDAAATATAAPSTNTVPPVVAVTIPSTEDFSNQVIKEANINQQLSKKLQTPSIADTTTSSTITIVTNGVPKKKRSKKHQSNRQPDLVYSCPRPLAFPFHNDDHFLPIAEADPRDVARVSPSLNRTPSFQSSSKTSVGSTRMYDNSQYSASSHRSAKSVDGASAYSRQSSILSTIQRGTVRSIRSFFQLPDSLNNDLNRVDTNQTSYSNQSSQTGLPRLEIKQGTVQSIKNMFSLKRSNLQSQRVNSPLQPKQQQQQKGRVGTTISQYESSASLSKVSQMQPSPKLQQQQQPKQRQASEVTLSSNQEQPKSKPKISFASRATKFASRALWMPKTPQEAPSVTQSSLTKPLPKPLPQPMEQETYKKSLKSEVKKISARMFSLPKAWTKEKNKTLSSITPVTTTPASNNNSLPRSTSIKSVRSTLSTASTLSPSSPPPALPKRSLFSAFRRSDKPNNTLADNNKKIATAQENEDIIPPSSTATTTVGKMWKSFKNLVTGKKSSRVGVL
ncbi:hypothetical protein A0J61_06213 [Choanephora cucurbitarum]|uniref:Uncharacterized protein n=1 Tax=Choanephora cucurbitarum TaxID=101091 RepID=A0A1C7N9V8_9FUNG|nr:hypothetical protein A0J61_06213 [Choanephora cucurbitarum]